MSQNKLFIMIIAIASMAFMASCKHSFEKRRIEQTVREYVEQDLADRETFKFVGQSNRRDTVLFMGETRPCVGVIYIIQDQESGTKTRHFADIIFSDDYQSVLYVKELDFDPIETVKEKVTDKLKEEILKSFGE